MGREVAEQATKRRGRVRRFMAWLGYGPETEPEERPDHDARRARGKAEAAERRARRRAERLARRESRRAATEEVEPVEVPPQEASAPSAGAHAGSAPHELQERLAEMESRARSAEQQAEEARARVADAQASADRARAAAEEARHGIGTISTKLARVEAERRLHEQAARRLESRCAELQSALELEREEKTVIVEHFDRRLAAIEETAEAAAKRVAAAERELIKGSSPPWFDGEGRAERADPARNGDPLDALQASIGKDKPRRDGRPRELDRPRGDAREPSRTG
jgi:colicin import membrane protein